jgi:oligoribonuclease NrnB/cAMP/cGMP phosphodiesterase (DHH superfamily)
LNSIIVSHESDVDGIFSASIALMRYPQSKVFFTSYGKDSFLRIADLIYKQVISSQGIGLVIFTDLGLNDESISSISDTFNFLDSNSWSVLWIDHHPWSKNASILFEKHKTFHLVLDTGGNKCASELTFEHLLYGNDIAKQLASIAHTSDYLLKDQDIPPLPELIVYYRTLSDFYSKITHLAKRVSEGVLWDTEMQSDFKTYVNLRNEAKSNSLKKIRKQNLSGGLTMAIIPVSSYIQISLFSEEIFQKTAVDVAFFYNDEGKVSIRRNNPVIKCNKIAHELIEGGGHEYAAGGKMKSNPAQIDEVLEELQDATKTWLEKECREK